MKTVLTFTFTTYDGKPGTGKVLIDMEGHYIPDSPQLGMGHSFKTADRAMRDLLYRHGATLIQSTNV